MSAELLRIYRRLQAMADTPEVRLLSNDLLYTLRIQQREHLMAFLSIGDAIGYDELHQDFQQALGFLHKLTVSPKWGIFFLEHSSVAFCTRRWG